MKTRYQARHDSIMTVHGPPLIAGKKKPGKKNKNAKKPPPNPDVEALKEFVKEKGVTNFISQLFVGDITLKKRGTVSRMNILALLDKDKGFRNVVSNNWRQENDHHHEWIPCTYLNEIIIKAITSNDFRYIQLANEMRTPTADIIFEPELFITVTPSGRPQFAILQAHPGGLKFHAPAGDPLGRVPVGHDVAVDNKPQTYGQADFHTDILKVLEKASSPLAIVDGLFTLFDDRCWDGAIPSTKHNVANVWPYYYRSGGTQNLSGALAAGAGAGGAAPPAGAWPIMHATFTRVSNQFNAWRGKANAPKPTSKFKL